MKIAVADNNGGKFSAEIIEHWRKEGHEVRFEPGMSEHLAQWADLYYMDCWDNNIHYLYKLYHDDPDHNRTPDWDNNKKPKVIVRALDWEVWIGLARDQAMIDWVDKCIVIAPHIEAKLRADNEWGNKICLIRPGVNLEKFTLKKPYISDGYQIGMVLGDMWWPKNHMGGLDIFTTLYQKDKRWRLHIRGQHEGGGGGEYWKQMYEHYLDSRGIRQAVTLYPSVPDMNEWLEKIDILLHPGMKEAFCYAIGEAMAKGIPPVVNEFYGSKDIWPINILYKTHDEAIEFIEGIKNSAAIYGGDIARTFIEEKYNLKRMMLEYDKLLQL